jgi:hypothetical protein
MPGTGSFEISPPLVFWGSQPLLAGLMAHFKANPLAFGFADATYKRVG